MWNDADLYDLENADDPAFDLPFWESLVRDLAPLTTSDGMIGAFPVKVPQIDMHTVGAGGGSIAWVDVDGSLQVGPRSAGAQPGPAAYGLGGAEPTVTDANVVLGRIGTTRRLGGSIAIDPYFETSRRGVFAVGDVHGDIKLITVAWAEGIQAAIYAFKEITSPYWLNEKRLRDHKIAMIGNKLSAAAGQHLKGRKP